MAYKSTGQTQRDEHAVISGVAGKKVFVVDSSGNQIIDFGGGGNVALQTDTVGLTTYVGTAAIGSSSADPVWRIKMLDESTDPELIVTWADGNANFDNIWDNRVSLSYS